MRPKLRGDTKYVPTSDGIYLQNNRRVLRIPGKQVYQWIDRLAPYLDGDHSLAELTEGLSSDRAEMVDQLVEMLAGAGFVKDIEADDSHTLSPAETDAYAPEIAFIDYFCDSAAARFEAFRRTRVVAVGSGQTLTALVAANLAVGLRTVDVLVTGECLTDLDRCRRHLETARQRDPDQTLTVQTVTGWGGDEGAVRAALEPFDAVVHVSDRPMLGRATMVDRICRAEGKVLVQAVVEGDLAWIGPLISPDDEQGMGWESAWRRLQATRTGSTAGHRRFAFNDDLTAPVSEYLTSPTAALVANQASFEVFKHLAGVPVPEPRGQLLRVDLETLRTTAHWFRPHPTCLPVAQVTPSSSEALAETVDRLARSEPVDEHVFSRQVRECFDRELGLFTFIDEGEFQQLPLNVCLVTLSNPALLSEPDEPAATVGVGTDMGMARRRAAQRACELYAASVVDERRLVQANGQGVRVWGYDLVEQRPRMVAAASVFPTLRGLVPSPGSAPWLASGFSWAEAVTTALASVCRQLTLAELDVDGEPFPLVDLDAGLLDEQGARYAQILRTWGVPIAVYDVTGTLQIPSFAFCVGDQTVAYRTGVDVRDALRCGLEQTVAYEQARANHQPDYAPPDVTDLPHRARGVRPTPPQLSSPGDWAHQQHRLCDALMQQGRRVVVVPLDHDPAVTDVLPHIVNLVVEPEVTT
ncbi:MAG TPA: TOMM precursor leader peptide-binding protein [Pseudonocardiaceae bacterium]|nr:TOMM precursor leader peptide-binding protein [Pseudonocardiaceae bacterium]